MGSWSEEDGVGAAGMVLRDEMGEIIVSACKVLPNCNCPLEAELRACSDGVNLGMQWTDTPIIIESDCLVAIQMITDTEINRSKLAFWVNSVKHVG
jgi:ribonuclease HI